MHLLNCLADRSTPFSSCQTTSFPGTFVFILSLATELARKEKKKADIASPTKFVVVSHHDGSGSGTASDFLSQALLLQLHKHPPRVAV